MLHNIGEAVLPIGLSASMSPTWLVWGYIQVQIEKKGKK